jgi:hypothetical protein
MTMFDRFSAPMFATTEEQIPTPAMRWAVITALSAVAMLMTLHVWFNVFHIPFEMPSPSLFDAPRGGPPALWMGRGEKPMSGWMAWYLPVLVTAFLAAVILARLTRRRERWSVVSLAMAGCVAMLTGATVAYWAEHNGFMWYYRPEMTLRLLGGVQAKLLMASLGEAFGLFCIQWPVLLIGAIAGVICALVAGAPLTRGPVEPPSQAVHIDPLDESTDLTGRIVSTIAILLASQMGPARGHPYYMLAIGACIALAWFSIAFPRVEFNFKRLLLGSFVASIISALIQTWLLTLNSQLAATFKGVSYVTNILLATHMRNFVILFIMNILSLTLVFSFFAWVTVRLCRRRPREA